jgi:hypothetical protein
MEFLQCNSGGFSDYKGRFILKDIKMFHQRKNYSNYNYQPQYWGYTTNLKIVLRRKEW